jgi:hypothetical protein
MVPFLFVRAVGGSAFDGFGALDCCNDGVEEGRSRRLSGPGVSLCLRNRLKRERLPVGATGDFCDVFDILFALGVGLVGRPVSVDFELIADGKKDVKELSPRRRLTDDSSLLKVGRDGGPEVRSVVFGSSLLLVCLWPGKCSLCGRWEWWCCLADLIELVSEGAVG